MFVTRGWTAILARGSPPGTLAQLSVLQLPSSSPEAALAIGGQILSGPNAGHTLGGAGTFMKLVGWNADGLLFSPSADGNYYFLADPAGPAAGTNGVPVDDVFGATRTSCRSGWLSSSVPCFAAGTLIATLAGEAAVEDLKVGDVALTVAGDERPVIWVGQKMVRPAQHPRPQEVNPVRIRKGAFGENLPVRDLIVSPGHAVYVEGCADPRRASWSTAPPSYKRRWRASATSTSSSTPTTCCWPTACPARATSTTATAPPSPTVGRRSSCTAGWIPRAGKMPAPLGGRRPAIGRGAPRLARPG